MHPPLSGTGVESFAAAIEPEIERIDLSGAVLAVKAWGDRALESFAWLTPPRPEALERARTLLQWIGALDQRERITARGRRLLRVPLPPRLARVLDAAHTAGVGAAGALAVALAEAGDLRRGTRTFGDGTRPPVQTAESDLLVLSDLFLEAEASRFDRSTVARLGLDSRALWRAAQVRDQLHRVLEPRGSHLPADRAEGAERAAPVAVGSISPAERDQLLLRAVLAGYPDRVARRQGSGTALSTLVGGTGVELDRSSVVRVHPFFVALEAIELPARTGEKRTVRVRLASGIEPEWLEECFPGSVETRDEVIFDPRGQRVVARRVTAYRDLPLQEHETGDADPAVVADVLANAAVEQLDRALELSREDRDWLDRVRTLGRHAPEAGLADPMTEIVPRALRMLCYGRRSFAELRRAPLLPALQAELTPEQARLLAQTTPASVPLPSGRQARVDYSGETPVLAARLQEFFGAAEGPRLGNGRVPLLLHLLAPSHRPLQVTQDLPSFWRNVYPKVRGELRRRYPKHSWPEDPLQARPESRPGGGKRKG
ncbi:MAG: ATP-dependent helicase C-terminal domain-containing protein [Candidatus Eisenbacteria bacterium]